MSRPPSDHLLRHTAPRDLLAASRQARRRRPATLRAVVVAATVGLLVGTVGTRWIGTPVPTDAEVSSTRQVTLVYHAPEAASVAVVGSFGGWDPAGVQMRRVHDGTFRTTLWLPAGQHEYQFVVDGKAWVPDPLASRQRPDGFGSVNSVVDVL